MAREGFHPAEIPRRSVRVASITGIGMPTSSPLWRPRTKAHFGARLRSRDMVQLLIANAAIVNHRVGATGAPRIGGGCPRKGVRHGLEPWRTGTRGGC